MNVALMRQIAETDATFTRQDDCWVGRCLICNGPVRFDARTGQGANIEHIQPRSLGGTSDLRNLGVTHARCNSEKGVHWDAKARRRADPARYAALVARLQAERLRRWRDVARTTTAATTATTATCVGSAPISTRRRRNPARNTRTREQANANQRQNA